MYSYYSSFSEKLTSLSDNVKKKYQAVYSDGLLYKIHNIKKELKIEEKIEQQRYNSVEQVFVDEDLSVELFECIKRRGNPDSVGTIYQFTWDDIIAKGLKNESDFVREKINNLSDLENYIKKKKTRN